MKKLLIASLLLGAMATTAPLAQAQTEPVKKVKAKKDKIKVKAAEGEQPADQGRPEGRGGRGNRMAELTQELNLTPEQQTKVTAIWQEQMQAMQAARANNQGGDRAAMREQMQAQRVTTDAKLKEVLTPEQYQKYQAKQQERMQRMGPPPGGNR
ncbi:hypothetical protein [Hymenobacter pini]|uniref:hypothetical protein n=1 Tax=Hymenobacter pini TaxID=2880879 RepID=UPI001CF21BA9|nr:hypothetical protein [Hymenobacter pini]MCA8829756.1 hypothetical protein [Hymenobacter pini]